MITGKFFIPQFDTSDDSVSYIFRYKAFKNKNVNSTKDFPIYVSFKTHAIVFNFQGKVQNDKNSKEFIHGQFPILEIPLGDQIYNEKSVDILSVFSRALTLNINEQYGFEKSISARVEALNYSALPIFFTDPVNKVEKNVLKGKQKAETNFFLSKLMLDFLDDFFNANVFQLSPSYQDLKKMILESYALKGIYLKADFYLRAGQHDKKIEDQLLRSKYLNSLNNWIEFINNKDHHELFRTGSGWFNFSDVESLQALNGFSIHKKAKEQTQLSSSDKQQKLEAQEVKQIVRKTVMSLIKEYEIFKATYVLFSKTFQLKSSLTWFGLVLVLFFLWHNILVYTDSWKWFVLFLLSLLIITIFFLIGFAKNFFRSAINLIMPRLMMAITTSWIAILSNIDYLKKGFIMSPLDAFKYSMILCGITFIFLVQEIIRNTGIVKPSKIFYKSLNIVLPGWIMSMCIGLVGMVLLTKSHLVTSDFFDSKNIFRENIAEVRAYDLEEKKWADSLESLQMKLQTTDFKKSKTIRDSLRSVFDSTRKRKPVDKFIDHNVIYDSLYTYHLVDAKMTGKQTAGYSKDKVVYYYFFGNIKDFHIVLFPGFLILMSSFALFSGIFLTLLFDDKPVSEPL